MLGHGFLVADRQLSLPGAAFDELELLPFVSVMKDCDDTLSIHIQQATRLDQKISLLVRDI